MQVLPIRVAVGQNAPFRFIRRIRQTTPSLPRSIAVMCIEFSFTFMRAGREAPRYDALRKQREGRAHGLSRFCANLP